MRLEREIVRTDEVVVRLRLPRLREEVADLRDHRLLVAIRIADGAQIVLGGLQELRRRLFLVKIISVRNRRGDAFRPRPLQGQEGRDAAVRRQHRHASSRQRSRP